jgi:abortive infection bacteriophage resistance protein
LEEVFVKYEKPPLSLFTGVHDQIRKETATYFKTEDVVLESWLRALNGVRNIAAHHGRLWNRTLGYKPLLPYKRKQPQWYVDEKVKNEPPRSHIEYA